MRRDGDGWECVDGSVVTKGVAFPKNLADVQYFVGEKLEDFGMLGSRIVQNVVDVTGESFYATDEPEEEEQLFGGTWKNTGLSPQSEYLELPAVKAKTYRTTNRTGWAMYQGHVFRAFDVGGDGNCLFRAVSLGMYGTQMKHCDVRRTAVRTLREHWYGLVETIDGLTSLPAMLTESWKHLMRRSKRREPTVKETEKFEMEVETDLKSRVAWFCDELAKDKVWGGDESIMAISKAFDISIVVLNVDSSLVVRQERPGRPEMYLRYVDGNHYHFLEPSKMCLEMPGSD